MLNEMKGLRIVGLFLLTVRRKLSENYYSNAGLTPIHVSQLSLIVSVCVKVWRFFYSHYYAEVSPTHFARL
jgi:nucleoside diphosphate kinase